MPVMAQFSRAGPSGQSDRNLRHFARFPRGLTRAHEARLARAARENQHKRKEHLLILSSVFLQVILSMGRGYVSRGLTLEKVAEIGQRAVQEAVLTWDRQTKFSEYAVSRIQAAFERFLRQMGRRCHDAADG